MAFDLTALSIQDEFGNNVTDYSRCNVGDKLTITYDVSVYSYAKASTSNPIILNYSGSGVIGLNWVYDAQGGFKDFKIGDTCERKRWTDNAVLNASIVVTDKVNDQLIKFDTDLASVAGTYDDPTEQSIINLKASITALKYFWNFIENDEAINYNSKIDNSIQLLLAQSVLSTRTQTIGALVIGQKYYISDYNAGDIFTNVGGANVTGTIFTATGTTPTTYSNGSTLNKAYDMVFQGAKPYQTGSALIVCMGNDTSVIYGQKFKIIHYTYFTPFFLSPQWTDLVAGINPIYYVNNECLKQVFSFEAMYNYNDPNRIITYTNDLDTNYNNEGNSGGYGENFNTGINHYTIGSVTYTDNASNPISEIALTTDETNFTIVLNNTDNSPFSNNNTKFTLNFIRAPFDESEYQGNAKTMDENFCFDRAHNTVGSASVDGDKFGTTWQVLKDVAATFTSSSSVTITGKIAFDSNVVSEISQSNEYRYLVWVAVQDHTKVSNNSDREAVIVDINTFYVDSSDTTMIVIDNKFINHVQSDFDTEGTTDIYDPHVEDEIVARSRFYIDSNGRESDSIVITSIEASIICYNEDLEEDFTLDRYSVNMANVVPSGDITQPNFQNINLTIPRVFNIPTTEIRKNVLIQRRTTLDTGGFVYFDVVFPFMVRWEYWVALAGVNAAFFDATEPNDGFNQEWYNYTLNPDWGCYYQIKINAKKNGIPQQYVERVFMPIKDYLPTPANGTIKTYDSNNVELYNAAIPRKYVLGYEDTKIVATFNNLDTGFDPDDCEVVIGIEVYEQGGVIGRRSLSSVNPRFSNVTWLKSISGNGLVVKTNPTSTTLAATCYIDKSLIPGNKPIYSISARLYYPPFGGEYKLLEIGTLKLTEDGIGKGID